MSFSITCQILPDGRRKEIEPMFPGTQMFAFETPRDRRLTVSTAQFNGIQLNRVTSSGHTIRLTETNRASYLVPRRGAIEVGTTYGSFASNVGGTLVFSPNTRTTRVAPCGANNSKASALLVDVADLREYLALDELSTASDDIEHHFDHRSALPEELALRDYVDFLERELVNRPLAFAIPRVKLGASALMKELFGHSCACRQHPERCPRVAGLTWPTSSVRKNS